MKVLQKFFDQINGQTIFKFTIENDQGNYVSFINYGAIIQEIVLQDINSVATDIVLGFSDIKGYEQAGGFIGATVGRCANRIGEAKFFIKDNEYFLYKNDGDNSLHGGKVGFSKRVWGYQMLSDGVVFSYFSEDGEEGYPGNLWVFVIYRFNNDNKLSVEYRYSSDQDTIVNLTNHSYFNLNGVGNEDALLQKARINSEYYTPLNEDGSINGTIEKVEGTCFDFREETEVRANFDKSDQLKYRNGFDHNYVLSSSKAAKLVGTHTGIRIEISTDYPGLQFYSGNYIREVVGKEGQRYSKYSGICFEPQYFPNSINVPQFTSPIVEANKLYSKNITYHFFID